MKGGGGLRVSGIQSNTKHAFKKPGTPSATYRRKTRRQQILFEQRKKSGDAV